MLNVCSCIKNEPVPVTVLLMFNKVVSLTPSIAVRLVVYPRLLATTTYRKNSGVTILM